jgi:S-disulfanyl-L-cysteine oxidoreductase SoxD
MSSSRKASVRGAPLPGALLGESLLAAALLVGSGTAWAQAAIAGGSIPGIGRAATAAELSAWDIDVRADFKGLPAGSGSVAQGMQVWEAKCASCHGIFGESNEVFSPLVGGTSKDDVRNGRAARLTDLGFPGRTTLMKLSSVSTLWDYIRRAMPWNEPKSLAVDEVYAVTAYLLHLGDVLPADFVLSDRTIAQVQQLLPNRNGMTVSHGLWPGRTLGGKGRPDVAAKACMRDCPTEQAVASLIPDYARNAHGNLAEQNRPVGAQVGADTTRPSPQAVSRVVAAAAPVVVAAAANNDAAAQALASKHSCMACHGLDRKLVGPGLREIAARHGARPDAVDYLAAKIKAGGQGVWGSIPMPPQALSDAEARQIAQWLAGGARK